MSNGKTWMHIGAGSFHRAHQAWYLHRLIVSGDTSWSIALGNIRDDATPLLETLAGQGGQYALETVAPAGQREYERIVSIKKIIPWDAELSSLVGAGADAGTGVIAFTVTESGYYLDTKFRLDRDNPDLKADLNGARTTIYGAVAAILGERIRRGGAPVTLLSCDNVRNNGRRFRDGLFEFLALRGDRELAGWAAENTSCPCCMVDRITPRPTPDIAPRVLAALGFADKAPVMGESFIQWVVEDDFAAGRPDLEKVGVEMVADVQPYEEAKIRILNVSHACIAWAGTLAGLRYIHEGALTPEIRNLARDYVTDDVIPCLAPSPLDLAAYRDTVLERFGNSYILDTNQRVASDGFSKIPAMVVPTLRECFARGGMPEATAMLPALFFVLLERRNAGGLAYEYQDGVLDENAVRAMFAAPDPVLADASDTSLFGDLAGRREHVELLRGAVRKARTFAK